MTDMSRISAAVLAGGKSSRMGRCKAELPFGDTTLIGHCVSKLRSLGIEDIIISGYEKPVEGARFAADVYAQKGPLGGIHAVLGAARYEHCLVLAVDTPLVPCETLAELTEWHIGHGSDITVLSHGDKTEPLIGVYARRLHGLCDRILCTDRTSVRELYKLAGVSFFKYRGDERLLLNCNTPEEYELMLKTKQT